MKDQNRNPVTKEEVRNTIRYAIGPYEYPITTVRNFKLRWYGHIIRSTGPAKMMLQGTVQRGVGEEKADKKEIRR